MADLLIDVTTWDVNPPSMLLVAAWAVVSWCGCCGFAWHNYLRLYTLTHSDKPWTTRALGAMVFASNAMYTLYTIDAAKGWLVNNWSSTLWFSDGNTMCAVWAIVDGVSNTVLSLFFVQALSVRSRDDPWELSPGYTQQLQSVRLLLGVESAVTVAVAVANLLVDIDPLFLTFYLAEALRLMVYTRFLNTLTRMLHDPNAMALRSMPSMPLGDGNKPHELRKSTSRTLHQPALARNTT
ncbi:hypothetical protein RI367_001618 [Sorochytrium milnesiophthora]